MTEEPNPHATYVHPLSGRYASDEMKRIWSAQTRHSTWRRVWVALAEAEAEAGLEISVEQIAALRAQVDNIDFEAAAKYEQEFRHDVMAHIHAFADAAPAARGIVHLGATSMDVVDNADLLLTREALKLLTGRLASACGKLAAFCEQWADQPTLGFTHLQPAQLTTVGKRAALWLQDLLADLETLERLRVGLRARGLRGATGTQASFLKLLGDEATVAQLERSFVGKLGFEDAYPLAGQTYSRRVDGELLNALASLGASVHRLCNDIRLLAMLKEVEEPFGKSQVGSSAMPYKRNPMRSERATGLARHLITLASNALHTHAAQMLERTLDDSSNKRIAFPESFLTADAIAIILESIFDGMVVYPETIAARIAAELPFMASEDILMEAVARGGDRQTLHEKIRVHAQAAGDAVKREGKPNDLIERLQADLAFAEVDWEAVLAAERYVGLAPAQTRAFVRDIARPALNAYAGRIPARAELRV